MSVIGEGVLTWPRSERIYDRYGVVGLMAGADCNSWSSGPISWVDVHQIPVGTRGRLQAKVLETRDSTHIGDLFRGFFPTSPEVGEVIPLGEGEVFHDTGDEGATFIGLRPDDGRDTDWLNPLALYRAHEQTVRLEFIPDEVAP